MFLPEYFEAFHGLYIFHFKQMKRFILLPTLDPFAILSHQCAYAPACDIIGVGPRGKTQTRMS